jgi:hypothetical protein
VTIDERHPYGRIFQPLCGLEAAEAAADDYDVVVCHSSFVIRRLSFVVRHSSFVNRQSSIVNRRTSVVALSRLIVGHYND